MAKTITIKRIKSQADHRDTQQIKPTKPNETLRAKCLIKISQVVEILALYLDG